MNVSFSTLTSKLALLLLLESSSVLARIDGLPDDHPRSGNRMMELFESLSSVSKAIFKEILPGITTRVTCAIGDGVPVFVGEVASEFGIPMIHYRTQSACCIWAFSCSSRNNFILSICN